jgi:hypothetical protein
MVRGMGLPRGCQGVALALCLALGTASCAARPYRFEPLDSVDFRSRSQTESAGSLRVTVAVPDAAESKALFGIPIYDRGIQPVWIEVENRGAHRVRFAPVGVDRDYFARATRTWSGAFTRSPCPARSGPARPAPASSSPG